MTQLKIRSTHRTLEEAVNAANVDISYNPSVAKQGIKDADTGFKRCPGTQKAFVMEDGSVFSIFKAEDGVNVLNKFEPFISVLSGGFFKVAVQNDPDTITITDATLPKNKAGRKAFADFPHLLAA